MPLKPDFGLTADDYSRHRAGFPDSLFERLGERGIGRAGERVVDLGTGTGTLARGFARRGCQVTGIDPSEEMLAAARELDAREDLHCDQRQARAEETGLTAAAFDGVAAGQCWHWFDRPRAARETSRLLKPGAWALIAHFDWIPSAGNVVEATEERIVHHNPRWKLGGGLGLYPAWLRDLGDAGFRELETFSYDVDVAYSPEAWRGRVRASAGVGGTLDANAVEAFDADLAALLAERFPGAELAVPHRVFALIARKPSG